MERGPWPLWWGWAVEKGYAHMAISNWEQENKTAEEGSKSYLCETNQERDYTLGETVCIWAERETKRQKTVLEIGKESLSKANLFVQLWLTETIEIWL